VVSAQTCPLSPVLRGEGWGEGLLPERRVRVNLKRPLTPTLSPEYRGEGESTDPALQVERRTTLRD